MLDTWPAAGLDELTERRAPASACTRSLFLQLAEERVSRSKRQRRGDACRPYGIAFRRELQQQAVQS